MILYLSIGTNIGDRNSNITQAINLLNKAFNTQYKDLSSIIETQSWGFESDNRFLNCVIKYDIDLSPIEVLKHCKSIEYKMGRKDYILYDEKGNREYRDRIIDIDILLYGDITMNSTDLTIPHPLMYERDFVMIPLKEIFD